MKPSLFATTHPYASLSRNNETETAAMTIMGMLAMSGDEWRKVSWEEYENYLEGNGKTIGLWTEEYFNAAVPYTIDEVSARAFSPYWKDL